MNRKERVEKYGDESKNPNPLFFLPPVRHPRDIGGRRKHDKAQHCEKSVFPAVEQSQKENRRRDDQCDIFLFIIAH